MAANAASSPQRQTKRRAQDQHPDEWRPRSVHSPRRRWRQDARPDDNWAVEFRKTLVGRHGHQSRPELPDLLGQPRRCCVRQPAPPHSPDRDEPPPRTTALSPMDPVEPRIAMRNHPKVTNREEQVDRHREQIRVDAIEHAPCPGIRLPLSLTPALRLSSDSKRSPMMPARHSTAPGALRPWTGDAACPHLGPSQIPNQGARPPGLLRAFKCLGGTHEGRKLPLADRSPTKYCAESLTAMTAITKISARGPFSNWIRPSRPTEAPHTTAPSSSRRLG